MSKAFRPESLRSLASRFSRATKRLVEPGRGPPEYDENRFDFESGLRLFVWAEPFRPACCPESWAGLAPSLNVRAEVVPGFILEYTMGRMLSLVRGYDAMTHLSRLVPGQVLALHPGAAVECVGFQGRAAIFVGELP